MGSICCNQLVWLNLICFHQSGEMKDNFDAGQSKEVKGRDDGGGWCIPAVNHVSQLASGSWPTLKAGAKGEFRGTKWRKTTAKSQECIWYQHSTVPRAYLVIWGALGNSGMGPPSCHPNCCCFFFFSTQKCYFPQCMYVKFSFNDNRSVWLASVSKQNNPNKMSLNTIAPVGLGNHCFGKESIQRCESENTECLLLLSSRTK